MDEFRVWIGCLACYNDGSLIGGWYPASEAGEVTTKDLHAQQGIVTNDEGYVIGAGLYGPHEELWVMDTDCAPKGFDHEMSPATAQEIADALGEVEDALDDERAEAYFAWVSDHYGQPLAHEIADYVSDFEDAYQGIYESREDFAQELAEDMGLIPEDYSWPASYIDWERAARDLFMDYSDQPAPGGRIYVFRCL